MSIATTRTVDDIARGIDTIREVIDRIKTCKEFEARPGRLCQWCDFLEVCEAGSEAVQAWVDSDSLESLQAATSKDKSRK